MSTRPPITRKAAIFGIDGITLDLLQPWLDEGRMPNLAAFLTNGASGRLRSTLPPVSASAWTSFATGCNPGQHGLVDFTYPAVDGYDVKVHNGRSRAVPALWEIVGQAGGQVGIVSMPMTYPPAPVNGFMICSFLAPNQDSEYTYPQELKAEIAQTGRAYPLHMYEKGRGSDPRKFIRACQQMEIERAATVKKLLQEKSWDFFAYVFESTDNVQHEVWHLLDPAHPRHDSHQAAEVLPDILAYYETVDRLLGEMLTLVPKEALMVILSDHGFGPFHKFFYINNWLAQNGWLKFKRSPLSLLKRAAFHCGITPINALKWVTFLQMARLRKFVKRGRGGKMLRRLFLSFHDVDWSRTQAFSVGNFGQVYLNVQGKRPFGCIPPQEYERVRETISGAALALHDPVDGQVVKQVYKREEIFQGRSTALMPDLILHTDRAKFVSFGHADFGSNKVLEPSTGQTGHHQMIGVFGLKGPDIKQTRLVNASLIDLAPTILHYMGLVVPAHMDGQVLTAAFSDAFNLANPVKFSASSLTEEMSGDKSDDEADEQIILDKLRSMGYIA